MSVILRGKVTSYDNLAIGAASGRERTTGQTPSTEGMNGGTGGSTDPAGATSSTTAREYTNINKTTDGFNTSDPLNNIAIGVVALKGERLG